MQKHHWLEFVQIIHGSGQRLFWATGSLLSGLRPLQHSIMGLCPRWWARWQARLPVTQLLRVCHKHREGETNNVKHKGWTQRSMTNRAMNTKTTMFFLIYCLYSFSLFFKWCLVFWVVHISHVFLNFRTMFSDVLIFLIAAFPKFPLKGTEFK